jgi:hypothetical protein
VLVQDLARAIPASAKSLQDRDEIVVAQALELTDREAIRLRVRLRSDLLDQLARQLGDVRELRPWPLERGAELREKVPHSVLAARDPVGQERAHLRPPQAGAEADRVVDLGGGGHVVVHEPERLAPERLEEAVRDEPVDLLPQEEGFHAKRRVEVEHALDCFRRGPSPGDDLDEREEVHGVEGVADEESLRFGHVGLEPRRKQPRGRRADEGIRRRLDVDLRQQAALEQLVLGRAFLHDVRVVHGLFERAYDGRSSTGTRRHGELGPRALCVLEHLVEPALGVGMRVVHVHVDTVLDQAAGPTGTDDAASDDGSFHVRAVK